MPFNNNVGRELIKLLKLPVENYASCLAIFELESYTGVLNLLNYRGKTQVCTFIIQRIIETNSYITSEEDLEKVGELFERNQSLHFSFSPSLKLSLLIKQTSQKS